MLYCIAGKLIGRYYDENGEPTKHYRAYEAGVEVARKLKQNEADGRKKFPPCNSEWKQNEGSRVWCTNRRLQDLYFLPLTVAPGD